MPDEGLPASVHEAAITALMGGGSETPQDTPTQEVDEVSPPADQGETEETNTDVQSEPTDQEGTQEESKQEEVESQDETKSDVNDEKKSIPKERLDQVIGERNELRSKLNDFQKWGEQAMQEIKARDDHIRSMQHQFTQMQNKISYLEGDAEPPSQEELMSQRLKEQDGRINKWNESVANQNTLNDLAHTISMESERKWSVQQIKDVITAPSRLRNRFSQEDQALYGLVANAYSLHKDGHPLDDSCKYAVSQFMNQHKTISDLDAANKKIAELEKRLEQGGKKHANKINETRERLSSIADNAQGNPVVSTPKDRITMDEAHMKLEKMIENIS